MSQYIETALWSSTDDDGEPLDGNYGPEDLAPETRERMDRDLERFFDLIGALGERYSYDDLGHDLWLTRNRHGAGFWDGDYLEPEATILTDAAHSMGPCDLYVGDDGQIYAM